MVIKNRFWRRPNIIREETKIKKNKWDREIRNRNKKDGRIKSRDDKIWKF